MYVNVVSQYILLYYIYLFPEKKDFMATFQHIRIAVITTFTLWVHY